MLNLFILLIQFLDKIFQRSAVLVESRHLILFRRGRVSRFGNSLDLLGRLFLGGGGRVHRGQGGCDLEAYLESRRGGPGAIRLQKRDHHRMQPLQASRGTRPPQGMSVRGARPRRLSPGSVHVIQPSSQPRPPSSAGSPGLGCSRQGLTRSP